jgi:hypothetical protein
MRISKSVIIAFFILIIIIVAYLVYQNITERDTSKIQWKMLKGLTKTINKDQELLEKYFRKEKWDKMLKLLESLETEKFRIRTLDTKEYISDPEDIMKYWKKLRIDDKTRLELETLKILLTVEVSPRKIVEDNIQDATATHTFKYSIMTERNDTEKGDQEMKHVRECVWR